MLRMQAKAYSIILPNRDQKNKFRTLGREKNNTSSQSVPNASSSTIRNSSRRTAGLVHAPPPGVQATDVGDSVPDMP